MKNFFYFFFVGIMLLSCTPTIPAWTEDFEAAKAQATKEGKDLLVNFSGSDWCVWCQKLDEEVFSTQEFLTGVSKKFVLVLLDYPQSTPQDPKIKAQNTQLAIDYAIEGYPTILLMDSEGRPFKRMGYQEGGPTPYLAVLNTALETKAKAYALLSDASKLQGIAKAEKLDSFYTEMEKAGNAASFSHIAQEIMSLAAGTPLANRYKIKQEFLKVSQNLTYDSDFDQVLATLARLDKEAVNLPLMRQEMYMLEAMIHFQISQDREKAIEVLNKAKALDPKSDWASQIESILEQL